MAQGRLSLTPRCPVTRAEAKTHFFPGIRENKKQKQKAHRLQGTKRQGRVEMNKSLSQSMAPASRHLQLSSRGDLEPCRSSRVGAALVGGSPGAVGAVGAGRTAEGAASTETFQTDGGA